MLKRMGLALTAIAASAATPAIAQDSEAPPPCEAAPYHAFDFWVGDWEVSTPDGRTAGTNSITKEEDGCLLVERWESARGTTGQSYNYYDPGQQVWRQVWVSPGVVIDYSGGLNQTGAMVLEGEISYRGGETHDFRGTWTPQADGSVRQHFEQYDAEAGEWGDWFTGIYRKAE